MGRIEIVLGPSAPRGGRGERIRRTFGVANFSLRRPVRRSISTRSRQRSCATSAIGRARSFRVSARRADKRFPLTSPQVEREVGGRIKEARGWTVDLDEPELDDPRSSC